MAVVYANDVIEIAVVQEHSSRPVVNVWHMKDVDAIAAGSIAQLVEDFAGNWQDHVMALQCDNLVLLRFDYRSLDPNDSTVGTLEPIAGKRTSGALNENSMPPNVAVLVKKNTGNRPRGRKDGRSFLAGISEGAIGESGNLEPAAVTAFNTSLSSFYNGISDTGTWNTEEHYPVVLETTPASRAPGTQAVTVNARRVTSLTVDPVASTQRDRLR